VRVARALALAMVAAAALVAPAAQAAGDEAVRLGVDLPDVVASAFPFGVNVHVTADPGALDPRIAPLRVRVRAAAECGGSFDTTSGPVLVDEPLRPDPAMGAAYDGTVAGSALIHTFGDFTACTYLEEQGDNRLFAFEDAASFSVTHPCTTFTRRASVTAKHLKRTRKAMRRAHGARRQALARQAARQRARLAKARAGRRQACHP
jgi:hypothetical protein